MISSPYAFVRGAAAIMAEDFARDWNDAGAWQQLHESLLAELHGAGALDWSRSVIDGPHIWALKGGPNFVGPPGGTPENFTYLEFPLSSGHAPAQRVSRFRRVHSGPAAIGLVQDTEALGGAGEGDVELGRAAAEALDNPAPVVQVIAAWQHTAEVHADPGLAARIQLLDGDFGPEPVA